MQHAKYHFTQIEARSVYGLFGFIWSNLKHSHSFSNYDDQNLLFINEDCKKYLEWHKNFVMMQLYTIIMLLYHVYTIIPSPTYTSSSKSKSKCFRTHVHNRALTTINPSTCIQKKYLCLASYR